MKKIINLIILFMLSINIVAHAEGNVIKVGYWEGESTHTSSDTGKTYGLTKDYFDEISLITGDTYEFILLDIDEDEYEYLNAGIIDLFGPYVKTDEREEKFLYSTINFGTDEVVFATSATTNIGYNDFNAIQGKRIGINEKDGNSSRIYDFMQKNNIEAEIISINENQNRLGRDFDVILTSTLQMHESRNVIAKLATSPYYFVAKLENYDVITPISQAVEQILENNAYFYEDIYVKNYGRLNYANYKIEKSDYEEFFSKEVYKVGYTEHHRPFSYINKYGEPSGTLIHIMNEIAEVSNISIEYINIDRMSPDEHIDINLSIIDSNTLDTHSRISEKILDIPLVLIGTHQILEKNVGIIPLTTISKEQIQFLLPNSNITEFLSTDSLVSALQNGDIDHVVISTQIAKSVLESIDTTTSFLVPLNMSIEVELTYDDSLSIEEVNAFNNVILSMDSTFLDTVVMDALANKDIHISVANFIERNNVAIAIFIGILIILCIVSAENLKKKGVIHALNIDNLTGLVTESKFIFDVSETIKNSVDQEYSIVSIDVDNFKLINEIYGYEVGTKCLITVARYFKDCFQRDSKICRVFADNYLLFIKTEEIPLCLKGSTQDASSSEDVLKNVLGNDYNLSLSIGVYNIKDKSKSIIHMIDCANIAKQTGKGTFGNTLVNFTESTEKEIKIKNEIVSTMVNSIKNHEFVMVYQPKYDLSTEKIVGAEALVRWIKEDGTQIFPNNFIPLFEKNGFIAKLDYYVFNSVCKFLSEHENVPKISINLSGITLMQNDMCEKIYEIVSSYELSPDRIEVEITESAMVENFDIVINQIAKLKKIGFSISLDDFGSGVSSLNRLKDLIIDILKLDKEFLGDTLINVKGITIIKNVIEMTKQLGIKIVAEGVETIEQVELLKSLGCDMAQGYYYAKPLSEKDFLDIIK